MFEYLNTIWTFILNLPPEAWAVIAGLTISWAGTQAVKFQLSDKTEDAAHKRIVRLVAMVLGAVPVFALWPTHGVAAGIWALAMGVTSPIAYTVAMKALYRYAPWLENSLSSRPVVRYDADGNATGIRMDPADPNDKTVYFKKPPTQPPAV